jgi:heterodisulfide reductase subunit C
VTDMTEDIAEAQETKIKEPTRVNPEFKHKVLEADGGNTLRICFQCGTCAAGCIVANLTGKYHPRKLIRMAQLGLEDRIMTDENLWLCSTCYHCTDNCPQGVEVKDVIRVLQNLAAKKGYLPTVHREFGKEILKSGYAYKLSKFKLKKRDEKGLPPVPESNVDEVQKLAEVTGFKEILDKEAEK